MSKATTNDRRVKSLKDTIAIMKKDGSITQHEHDSMNKILDAKGNGLIMQPENVYVGRTEVPDEILTPLKDVVEDPAPIPAVEDQLPHDEPVALPLPGDEAVDVSPQVDEPELMVGTVPASAPDPDPELVGHVWGNLSSKKKTKKGERATKKKKKRVSSTFGFEDSPEESVVPERLIEHKSREEARGSDEEWGKIEMPDKSTSMDGKALHP